MDYQYDIKDVEYLMKRKEDKLNNFLMTEQYTFIGYVCVDN